MTQLDCSTVFYMKERGFKLYSIIGAITNFKK